jgi:hypothetical protein
MEAVCSFKPSVYSSPCDITTKLGTYKQCVSSNIGLPPSSYAIITQSWRQKQYVSPKRRYPLRRLHGTTKPWRLRAYISPKRRYIHTGAHSFSARRTKATVVGLYAVRRVKRPLCAKFSEDRSATTFGAEVRASISAVAAMLFSLTAYLILFT